MSDVFVVYRTYVFLGRSVDTIRRKVQCKADPSTTTQTKVKKVILQYTVRYYKLNLQTKTEGKFVRNDAQQESTIQNCRAPFLSPESGGYSLLFCTIKIQYIQCFERLRLVKKTVPYGQTISQRQSLYLSQGETWNVLHPLLCAVLWSTSLALIPIPQHNSRMDLSIALISFSLKRPLP